MKRVALLGSTGSIGASTLDVIRAHPDELRLVGIAAHSNVALLAEQAAAFGVPVAAVWNAERAEALRRLAGPGCRVLAGEAGLIELATHPDVDVVVVATSGGAGLVPLVRAIEAGKRIALASKELLVMAGGLILRLARERRVTLIPIDSEHAALLQCLEGVPSERVRRLTVTGSGGPLWRLPASAMAAVTRAQVLNHPKWRMGQKITVDSATLMNKGLELIEAQRLFGVPLERLRVLIHPEAVVHAMVELEDGTMLAQLSPCDMRLPIRYALSYPERWVSAGRSLAPEELASLHFHEPDLERFPCLRLAMRAAEAGPGACVVLNGANDAAVRAYLEDAVSFTDIPRIVSETLDRHTAGPEPALEEVLELDAWARATAHEVMHQWSMR
ncbi:MAG TPA: 1-deoxy-D-xylulose-5-phosphate reductoisomerase [bacterium]